MRHGLWKNLCVAFACACGLTATGCGESAQAPNQPVHSGLSHAVREKTPYYRNVPGEADRPAGFFEAGTPIKVLRREENGYWRVEAVDSGVVYVAADAVGPDRENFGDENHSGGLPAAEKRGQDASGTMDKPES
jgi:hypothetical protein